MLDRSINSRVKIETDEEQLSIKSEVTLKKIPHDTTCLIVEDLINAVELCQPHSSHSNASEVMQTEQISNGFNCSKLNSPPSEVFTKSDIVKENAPVNVCSLDISQDQINQIKIPYELWSGITKAAKQGFLFSFLLTLTEEYISHELKKRGYKDEDIHLVNQSIKALTLIIAGHSLIRIVATPVANYILINIAGVNETNANAITLGAVVTIDILTNPIGLLGSIGLFGTGITCSLVGSKIAKSTSSMIFDKSIKVDNKRVCEIEMVPLGASRKN